MRTSRRSSWPTASWRCRRSATARCSSAPAARRPWTRPASSRAATGARRARTQKTIIISRQHAYHGMNAYGTSLGGIPANLEGYGVMIPETLRVSWDNPEDLEEMLDRYDGRVAAYIGEPVIGAGGVIEAPDGYWPEIRAHLHRARDPLHPGRGHLRLRPAGRELRLHALRRRARHDHVREGRHVRLPAARRHHRRADDQGLLLGRGRAALPPRVHVQRPRGAAARRASRTSTSSSARA